MASETAMALVAVTEWAFDMFQDTYLATRLHS